SKDIKSLIKFSADNLNYTPEIQGKGLINMSKAIAINEKIPEIIIELDKPEFPFQKIIGTAKGISYEIYLSKKQTNLQWIKLYESSLVVENSTLYDWDISSLSNGEYYLKLVVHFPSFSLEDIIVYKNSATEITYPLSIINLNPNNDYVLDSRKKIQINGTVRGSHFEKYELQWCFSNSSCFPYSGAGSYECRKIMDYDLASCNSAGFIIENNSRMIHNNILGYWDIPKNLKNGFYTLRLLNYVNHTVQEDKIRVYIETEYATGWPQRVYNYSTLNCYFTEVLHKQPVVADINNDNTKEILLIIKNKVYAFYSNGSMVAGFPYELPMQGSGTSAGAGFKFGPTVGNFNSDRNKEIAFGDMQGWLYIIDKDGKNLSGWPKKILMGAINPPRIAASDLNNDGFDELIVSAWPGWDYVIDKDGRNLPGWPKQFSLPWATSDRGPSIGDLNRDGKKELIFFDMFLQGFANPTIIVTDIQGNILPGWPKNLGVGKDATVGAGAISPQIIDLNNDGNSDILFMYNNSLYAFDYLGKNLTGFPFVISELTSAIAGDLNNDGINEIILSGKLNSTTLCGFVYEYNNTLILKSLFSCDWQKDQVYAQYNLVNVRNTENQIILSSKLYSNGPWGIPILRAYNMDGSMAEGFPKAINRMIISYDSFGIDDLNNDKTNEMVALDCKGNLIVYSLGGNADNNIWGQYHHDAQHTGCTDCNTTKVIPVPACRDDRDNDFDGFIDTQDRGCWKNVSDVSSYDPNDDDESNEIFNTVQSKLVNSAASILTGQLQIKFQKKINGIWQDISTNAYQQITIPANGLLKLDTGKDNLGAQVFTGFNNLNVKASSAGDYRVYARFEKSGQFVESNWEFMVV
ncbi:MAG: VCBS repeat-containing protein, partial [Nanoarchaeota archaeon]